jgi:hypothetical protein
MIKVLCMSTLLGNCDCSAILDCTRSHRYFHGHPFMTRIDPTTAPSLLRRIRFDQVTDSDDFPLHPSHSPSRPLAKGIPITPTPRAHPPPHPPSSPRSLPAGSKSARPVSGSESGPEGTGHLLPPSPLQVGRVCRPSRQLDSTDLGPDDR